MSKFPYWYCLLSQINIVPDVVRQYKRLIALFALAQNCLILSAL